MERVKCDMIMNTDYNCDWLCEKESYSFSQFQGCIFKLLLENNTLRTELSS